MTVLRSERCSTVLDDAAKDPRVRAVFLTFVREQRLWGAEDLCRKALAELVPPKAERDWSVEHLGRRVVMRVASTGRWAMRPRRSKDQATLAANAIVARFGVSFASAWRAVRRGVDTAAAELAEGAADPATEFDRAVTELAPHRAPTAAPKE